MENRINIAFIFKNIWFSPKKTIRYILDAQSSAYQIRLWVMAGMASAFSKLFFEHKGANFNTLIILGIVLLAGSFLGFVSVNLFSVVINWTGKLVGGKGNRNLTLTAISWGLFPYIFRLFIYSIALLIYGSKAFTQFFPNQAPIFYLCILLTELFSGIFFMVISIAAISEAHEISILKTIGTVLLSGLVILAPLSMIRLLTLGHF